MKKIVLPLLICSSFAQAGTMGAVADHRQHISPYLTGEAVYTWNSVQPSILNNVTATQTKQGWGGRLGGGFAFSIAEEWALTSEIGGGYYGNVSSTAVAPENTKLSFDGYDILFGGIYKYEAVDIFGQAGFMLQNSRATRTLHTTALNVNNSSVSSQALPEIKVGLAYNFGNTYEYLNALGVSVAYMHVFGTNVYTNLSETAANPPAVTVNNSNSQGATFDAVMFGLRYTIA
jgi:hypothetical protein